MSAVRIGPFLSARGAEHCEICQEAVWAADAAGAQLYMRGPDDSPRTDTGPTVLPCGHYFHAGCARKLQGHTCPVCRAPRGRTFTDAFWEAAEARDEPAVASMAPVMAEAHPESIVKAASYGRARLLLPARPCWPPRLLEEALWAGVTALWLERYDHATDALAELRALSSQPGLNPNAIFSSERGHFGAEVGSTALAELLRVMRLCPGFRALPAQTQAECLASVAGIPGTDPNLGEREGDPDDEDDPSTRTPLMLALALPLPLLERVASLPGTDPDAQDERGRTALHLALDRELNARRALDVVKVLLRTGAKAGVRNDAGRTPLDDARSQLRGPHWADKAAAQEVVTLLERRREEETQGVRRSLESALAAA
jgi:hypothetical protein